MGGCSSGCRPPVVPPSSFPPVAALGFSKGGVLLNQLLMELAELQVTTSPGRCCLCARQERRQQGEIEDGEPDAAAHSLLSAICTFLYLDVGMNAPGAYLTQHAAFAALGQRCRQHTLQLMLWGTPRQWSDNKRPWVGQEAGTMAATAAAAGVPLQRQWCGQGWPDGSLEQHFAVLDEFSVPS